MIEVRYKGVSMTINGDWLTYRHDNRLSGRSPLKGEIRQPRIAWKHFVGLWEGLIEIESAEGEDILVLPKGKVIEPDFLKTHGAEWGFEQLVDLYGEGELIPYRPSVLQEESPIYVTRRVAKLLPNSKGLQVVAFESAFQGSRVQRGYLYSYDEGVEKLVWRTEPEVDMYNPLIVIADIDCDGLPEVAVATHYRIMVYNGQTGKKKMEFKYHNMRNYGFFEAVDIDGDSFLEFIIIADFITHIEVIDIDKYRKDFKVLWRKDIETNLTCKRRALKVGPNPVIDIDGDGRLEIIFNLYNDEGDEKWHVIGLDALTGKVKLDIPENFLHGIADLDGDGIPELLCLKTSGLQVPTYSQLSIYSIKANTPFEKWRCDCGRWYTVNLGILPLNVYTVAESGKLTAAIADIDHDGKLEFFIGRPEKDGSETCVAYGFEKEDVEERICVSTPPGTRLELLAISESKHNEKNSCKLLVRLSTRGEGKVALKRASGALKSWHPIGYPLSPPVIADLNGSGVPTILLERGGMEIVALKPPFKEKSSKFCWCKSGRGMANNNGLMVADVDGDGEKEALVAEETQSGEASLLALRPDGSTKWTHIFRNIDGKPPRSHNNGGLVFWTTGHFTRRDKLDIFVTLRRSTMHSDEGIVLSGEDGREIWRKDEISAPGMSEPRGFGGYPVAVADLNGDGLDEILCEYPDLFWIVSGVNGETLLCKQVCFAFGKGRWVAYGIPVLADFDKDGKLESLWGGSFFLTSVLNLKGEPLWQEAYRESLSWILQGIGDIDGDGWLEIGGPSYRDGFRCYDAASGQLKWLYPLEDVGKPKLGATPVKETEVTYVCTTDVNGDGVEEFIFGCGCWLLALNCIGQEGPGGISTKASYNVANLVWSIEFPAKVGSPIIGDADGDGKAEVLLKCDDGYLYCVDC